MLNNWDSQLKWPGEGGPPRGLVGKPKVTFPFAQRLTLPSTGHNFHRAQNGKTWPPSLFSLYILHTARSLSMNLGSMDNSHSSSVPDNLRLLKSNTFLFNNWSHWKIYCHLSGLPFHAQLSALLVSWLDHQYKQRENTKKQAPSFNYLCGFKALSTSLDRVSVDDNSIPLCKSKRQTDALIGNNFLPDSLIPKKFLELLNATAHLKPYEGHAGPQRWDYRGSERSIPGRGKDA